MKPKEIHDLLLSLFIRGLGFWVLYLSTDTFFTIVDHVTALLSPDRDMHRPMWAFESDAIWMAAKLAVAAYLILGAPPFLKWATRDRGSR